MSKEKIITIIKSDKKDDEIIERLSKIFKSKPDLLKKLEFDLGSSFFHLVVLHNRYGVLKHFIEINEYMPYALLVDKNKESIMHYAVKNSGDTSSTSILNILIKKFPALIKLENVSGHTPLQEAVYHKRTWAIYILEKTEFDKITAVDQKLQSESEVDTDLMRKVALRLDLVVVAPLQLKSVRSPSRRELFEKFPQLTRNSGSSSSSGSSSINSSASSSARDSIFMSVDSSVEPSKISNKIGSGLVSWSQMIKETPCSPEDEKIASNLDANELLKKLIESYGKSNSEFEKVKQKFYILCKTVDLEKALHQARSMFLIPKSRIPLYMTLGQLYPLVQKEYKSYQDGITSFMNEFVAILVEENLLQEGRPIVQPDFDESLHRDPLFVDAIWYLVSGMAESSSKKRKYDLTQVSHTALGLQGQYSFADIVQVLIGLYPQFDKKQKLITHYIICQLVIYNNTEILNDKLRVNVLLKSFMPDESDPNYRSSTGLGDLRKTLSADLNKLIATIKSFNNNLLIRNFRLLNAWYEPNYSDRSTVSFDQLVRTAITKEPNEREDLVAYLAEELRIQSKALYRAPLSEFYNNNWSKPERQKLAPTLCAHAIYVDNLNNYFTHIILSQSRHHVSNALQFLIQLAVALCPLENDSFPDLNHIMLINAVLNRAGISRLSPYFSELPEKEKAIIEEIKNLTSNENNSIWLREIAGCRSTALPFVGTLQTALISGKEGNELATEQPQSPQLAHQIELTQLLNKAEIAGKIYLKLIQVNATVLFEVTHNQTDLGNFITGAYKPLSDEALYEASCRILPKRITLASYKNRLSVLCELIDKNYFSKDLVPEGVWIEEKNQQKIEKIYSPNEFLSKLLELYEEEFDTIANKLLAANKTQPAKSSESEPIKKINSKDSKESPKSRDSKDSPKSKEAKPESKNYRKISDWSKEFKQVAAKDIRAEIIILTNLLALLEKTTETFIEIHNRSPECAHGTVEKINLTHFALQIQNLKTTLYSIDTPSVAKLRKLSDISADPNTIRAFRSKVSIDPSIPVEPSSSSSSEELNILTKLTEAIPPVFSSAEKGEKGEKGEKDSGKRRGSILSREKSTVAAPESEVLNSPKKTDAAKGKEERKGSIRGPLKGLSLFKGESTSTIMKGEGSSHKKEGPQRPSILPAKSTPNGEQPYPKI